MDAIREAWRKGEISKSDAINVDVCNGPTGTNGFRSGMWPVQIGDCKFRVYGSVSHDAGLNEQERMIVNKIKHFLDHITETYIWNEHRYYRYTSQSERA